MSRGGDAISFNRDAPMYPEWDDGDTFMEAIAAGCYPLDEDPTQERKMESMRERIANVLESQTEGSFLDRADAVLAAIYDPTNHMVDEAGGEYVNLQRADDQCYQPRLIWQDMVDTARKEPR